MSKMVALRTFIILAGLVLLGLLICAWWLDVQNDQPQNAAQYHHWAYSVQPTTIEDWMTFDYLNKVFALPPSYLEETLHIQDAQYPDLSIKRYAQMHDLDVATFLTQVQMTLAAYTATSTP